MDSFKGTWRLVRLAIRRDRISTPVTLLLALGMSGLSAPALVSAYPNAETQLAYIAASAPSVVGRLFQGTVQGVNLGSIVMAEIFLFTSVIIAIMSILMVTRHTRWNEEVGAAELIGSSVVGKNSPLTSALIVTVLANAVFALLLFASLAPISELDVRGSAYFTLSLFSVGTFFAGYQQGY
jgi:ABC-2 type transport system permease protein